MKTVQSKLMICDDKAYIFAIMTFTQTSIFNQTKVQVQYPFCS